jgi:transposase
VASALIEVCPPTGPFIIASEVEGDISMVVCIGVDVHKRTHCAVATDEVGRVAGKPLTVPATDEGHQQLVAWSRELTGSGRVQFAVEDCRHVSTRLERDLLAAGQQVVRVPPKLMAGVRRSARTVGKSDPIDATAIARAALQNPDLPMAELAGWTRNLKLVLDHREDLVQTRTQIQNRLRWHLHELDPALAPGPSKLSRYRHLKIVAAALAQMPADTVQQIALELVDDITRLTQRINKLHEQISDTVEEHAPQLLTFDGCGALTAATLLAETGSPARFRSEACFAMHAGLAPIPASSGNLNRHRLARGGNRRLNVALHRIAITQLSMNGPGRTYYDRKRAEGKTSKEAIRALKRQLARPIWQLIKQIY